MTRFQTLDFYELMELSLYDPTCGYYTAGRVQFGDEADFWTFPERMSPIFGHVIAGNVLEMALALSQAGLWSGEDPNNPFTVVEFGAGRGVLASDILDFAEYQHNHGDPLWTWLFPRLRYLIAERSPALRTVQQSATRRHVEAGRLQHLTFAEHDVLPAVPPLVGLVLSNELFDVYPHHWLEVPNRVAYLTAGWPHKAGMDFKTAARTAMGTPLPYPIWNTQFRPPVPWAEDSDVASYLHALTPLFAHHHAHGITTKLFISPPMAQFAALVQSFLTTGFVITIDYGGTATQICDPEPLVDLLRTYPEIADANPMVDDTPGSPRLGWPGSQDITMDIDFTHLAFAGTRNDLDVVYFGPQGHLLLGISPERRIDPLSRTCREQMVTNYRHRTGLGELAAQKDMYQTAKSFCDQSPGFRVLVQKTRNVGKEVLRWSEPTDPVLPEQLQWLIRGGFNEWKSIFERAGFDSEAALSLRLLGDPWSDLEHHGFRYQRRELVAALQNAGFLNR
ncbi:MAG: SAM-dependent methyltransferase [Myxococcales bacterium]|nr:SAM-dependent methyltransferase [Myxococcales bacterium]